LSGRGEVVVGFCVGLLGIYWCRILTIYYVSEDFDTVSILLPNDIQNPILLIIQELHWILSILEHLDHLIELLLSYFLLEEVGEEEGTVWGNWMFWVE
jgi:hypothetical protein